MNKTEFVGEVAEKLGVTKKEVAPKVEAVFNVIIEALTKVNQSRFQELERLKFVNVRLVKGEIRNQVRKLIFQLQRHLPSRSLKH